MSRLAKLTRSVQTAILVSLFASRCFANGEIIVVRAPEEVIGGDDVSVLVTTTPREEKMNRAVAVEVPDSWDLVRAYSVESGAEGAAGLPLFGEIQSQFTAKAGRKVIVVADTATQFDPDAAGVAYFFVFSTKAVSGQTGTLSTTVKAALVERIDPDSPPEIDKKTKKPKERNTDWRMDYPPRIDWSFDQITSRRVVQPVQVIRVARSSRALVAQRGHEAAATLRTSPETLRRFAKGSFSISFWVRTTNPAQPFLTLTTDIGSSITIGTSLFGIATVSERVHDATGHSVRTLLGIKSTIVGDGSWHHILFSKDSAGTLRLFVDAQAPAVGSSTDVLNSITGAYIGDPVGRNDFSMDELRLSYTAYTQPTEYERTIATAARDTSMALAALFHFDEYVNISRTSVPFVNADSSARVTALPTYWLLDSNAVITETTSPVQFDQVLLSADLISPTKVSISWRAATEVGVKQYVLERRVGTYGAFEKVLSVDAKHGVRTPKRNSSIIARSSYTVSEELPKLNGDIELSYRLATIGFSEKDAIGYSEPVRLEYGGDREVFVEQNDPNPFNPVTQIAFRNTKAMVVRVSIFDIIGREVAVLFNGKADAGRHVYTLDATNWPGGIYFYKVKSPRTTVTRKMVLAK